MRNCCADGPGRGGRSRWQAAVPVGGGRAWLRCPWAAAGPGCGARGRRRGLAAVPVGGGRAWPRCPWAAAGPGCGARGRRQGLAGQHTDTPTDWRPPRGLRGLAGLRADAPSEARGANSERAGRPRGGRRSVGGTSDNSRNYSPARRSTSCMMRPHTALTHATAATPSTRDRQGLTCRKSSKP